MPSRPAFGKSWRRSSWRPQSMKNRRLTPADSPARRGRQFLRLQAENLSSDRWTRRRPFLTSYRQRTDLFAAWPPKPFEQAGACGIRSTANSSPRCPVSSAARDQAKRTIFASFKPRALGRKVSDEYTVPVCRLHHRELHCYGDESSWWAGVGVDPVPIALKLWRRSHGDVACARNPPRHLLRHPHPLVGRVRQLRARLTAYSSLCRIRWTPQELTLSVQRLGGSFLQGASMRASRSILSNSSRRLRPRLRTGRSFMRRMTSAIASLHSASEKSVSRRSRPKM